MNSSNLLNSPYNLNEPNGRVNELVRLMHLFPHNKGRLITRDTTFNNTPLWKLGWAPYAFTKARKRMLQGVYGK